MNSLFNQEIFDVVAKDTSNLKNSVKVEKTDSVTKEAKVYRFKFSPNIVSILNEFSKIHQYDNRDEYKEAWDDWCNQHNDMIKVERQRLEKIGYRQDILVSMYRSARYYYRTKSTVKSVHSKRRVYVPMKKEFLHLIDNHLYKYDNPQNWRTEADKPMKPSTCYDHFCEEYSRQINEETNRLISCGINKKDVEAKLKKTYKNRYFIYKTS